MIESTNDGRNSVRQLLALAALMAVGYGCIRTLRFTNGWLNFVFVCAFLLIPFLAIRPLLRLRRWPRVLTTILLSPFFAISLLLLLVQASCEAPALIEHRELSRELRVAQQGHYSIHLLWEETAGGAVGPHGVGLEQRMFIFPGLYAVKYLDYFEDYFEWTTEGSLSVEGADKVRLRITRRGVGGLSHEIDRVYSLKPWVYF
jgi:hypothetical protein